MMPYITLKTSSFLFDPRDQCAITLQVSLSLGKVFGVPIAYHKVEGPFPFLGVLIDTENCV